MITRIILIVQLAVVIGLLRAILIAITGQSWL